MKFCTTLSLYALLFKKDVLLEWRSKKNLSFIFLFAAALSLLFAVPCANDSALGTKMYPIALQISLLLASVLSIGRSFEAEIELGALRALLMAPCPHRAILMSKIAVNTLTCTTLGLFLMFGLALGLQMPIQGQAMLLQSVQVFLCALGLSSMTTPFAFLSVQNKLAESLLPVIVLPLSAPVLIAGISATRSIWAFKSALMSLLLLLVFSVVFLGFNFFLLEDVIEES